MDFRLTPKRKTIARQAWRSWDVGVEIKRQKKMKTTPKKNDYDDTKPTSERKRRVRCGIPRTQLRYAGEGVCNAAATANASHRGQNRGKINDSHQGARTDESRPTEDGEPKGDKPQGHQRNRRRRQPPAIALPEIRPSTRGRCQTVPSEPERGDTWCA